MPERGPIGGKRNKEHCNTNPGSSTVPALYKVPVEPNAAAEESAGEGHSNH